ncbi:13711_t:CDS:2 [Racocetra fulgida]|uniref:13711_t:CDS:1 n=1 Tax=Racocetra fulgida TaxID=60492 RepID=A0A9N8Z6G2_9GLOM|nr:13711_t:CDS:2 [Racocetra fulgida]
MIMIQNHYIYCFDELKTEYNNWINAAKLFPQGDHYVYIDIRNNEVFRGPPNKTTNTKHPGPSEELHKRQPQPLINQLILAGDGILNLKRGDHKNDYSKNMETAMSDIGGPVFLYTPWNLDLVDLFGIQVTSSLELTAALSYEIIQDVTGYTLYNGNDD